MDYLRQLGNDEKRCPSAIVATIKGGDLASPLAQASLAISLIPKGSVVGKVYAVVTEAFSAGSLIDWGVSGSSASFFSALDLTVVEGSRSAFAPGTVFSADTTTEIVPNASALGSNVGEVKLVIELTETDLKSGKYSA